MNLLFKKLIIAITLVVMPYTIAANQNMPQQVTSFQDLSPEEQQQLMEVMMTRKILAEVMRDLIRSCNKTIDWLLQNYTKEPAKGMEKIMQVVDLYLKNRANTVLNALTKDFGITDATERDEFINNAMSWLAQVIPSEFEKWIYLSVQANLVRQK